VACASCIQSCILCQRCCAPTIASTCKRSAHACVPGAASADVVSGRARAIRARGDDKAWIHLLPRAELEARAAELERRGASGLPLYGIPFAIKDNIDLAGIRRPLPVRSMPMSRSIRRASCSALLDAGRDRHRQDQPRPVRDRPRRHAFALRRTVQHVRSALYLGRLELGLGGRRCRRSRELALGTDTAGSGRVPASFNNLVGLKPTCGLLSTSGVVPACRSLDCVSIFALTAADAAAVLDVAAKFDSSDPFARREGPARAPRRSPAAGSACRAASNSNSSAIATREKLFAGAVAKLTELGAQTVEIDFAPFLAAARCSTKVPGSPSATSRSANSSSASPMPAPGDAADHLGRLEAERGRLLHAQYKLRALIREAEPAWKAADVLLAPTAGTHYTHAELEAEPIRLNSNLGVYTNFVNLMDLSAIAVPAGFTSAGLPWGVTLLAPAFSDRALCALGDELHRALVDTMGATKLALPRASPAPMRAQAGVQLAVCGAHLSGLPLNHQLTERGARLVRACRTAPNYRLYALAGFTPPRPGMLREEKVRRSRSRSGSSRPKDSAASSTGFRRRSASARSSSRTASRSRDSCANRMRRAARGTFHIWGDGALT
jgi:allophanate hydrolase